MFFLYLDTLKLNPLYEEFSKLHENLIARHLIEIKCEIASGQFGKVFKGLLRSEERPEETVEVAIKAPKIKLLNPESLNDFYQEANTAISFDHENVLKCLGMSDEPKELPYLLFEYMRYGDLATILANHRASANGCIHDKNLPILQQVRILIPNKPVPLPPFWFVYQLAADVSCRPPSQLEPSKQDST